MPRRNLSEPTRSFELHRPPRRGEVYWVAFGPTVGGEIRKTRPAVVVRAVSGEVEPLAVPLHRKRAPWGCLLERAHSVRLIPAEPNVL